MTCSQSACVQETQRHTHICLSFHQDRPDINHQFLPRQTFSISSKRCQQCSTYTCFSCIRSSNLLAALSVCTFRLLTTLSFLSRVFNAWGAPIADVTSVLVSSGRSSSCKREATDVLAGIECLFPHQLTCHGNLYAQADKSWFGHWPRPISIVIGEALNHSHWTETVITICNKKSQYDS